MLRAATQAGLDGDEVERGLSEPDVKQALREATDEAIGRRVYGVPTIEVGDMVWWGDDQLEAAAMHAASI